MSQTPGHSKNDAKVKAPKPSADLRSAPPIDTTKAELFAALLKRHKISEGEYARIIKSIGRTPSLGELGVFSAMWSEHCSYKSSRVHLKRFPTKGPNVVVGPGENAGVVRLEGSMCLAFKMESHNHPSYIEPYQGASTGVGGILRDVFCMGARPIANLNCLRFGERGHPRTKYIAARAVKGIGDYGNCIGVPTVGGSVSYDPTYNGNCLVNAMTVGLIRDDKIFKGFATGIGNLVVYLGSATGRDGIHGATMASDSFASQDSSERSTVQVGDPFAEKLLLEATLEVLDKDLVVGIQDMGAAGLTSSSFEMAGRAGNGVYIDLDRVPLRAKKMTAYEIMLSESQERMLMVIEPGKWPALCDVLERWGLAYAVIGSVTDTGRVQVSYQGVMEIDVPVAPLTDDAPVYERPIAERATRPAKSHALDDLQKALQTPATAKSLFLKMLEDTGSAEPIYRQYDQHVGTRTVYGPEHGGAAVLWVRSEETQHKPWIGVAIAAGCNERRVANDPYTGGADAVLVCTRAITAAGGTPLAVTDCLNFGSAEDPNVMREFSDAVDGISRACNELQIPVVSGNVSLYNSTDGTSIFPTPMIGVVGRVEDVRKATPGIATSDTGLFVIRPQRHEATYAASLAAKTAGISAREGLIPEIQWDAERRAQNLFAVLHEQELITAARATSQGGIGLASLKMILGAGNTAGATWCGDSDLFFAETGATYVVEPRNTEALTKILKITAAENFECVQVLTHEKSRDLVTLPFGTFSRFELNAAWNNAHTM